LLGRRLRSLEDPVSTSSRCRPLVSETARACPFEWSFFSVTSGGPDRARIAQISFGMYPFEFGLSLFNLLWFESPPLPSPGSTNARGEIALLFFFHLPVPLRTPPYIRLSRWPFSKGQPFSPPLLMFYRSTTPRSILAPNLVLLAVQPGPKVSSRPRTFPADPPAARSLHRIRRLHTAAPCSTPFFCCPPSKAYRFIHRQPCSLGDSYACRPGQVQLQNPSTRFFCAVAMLRLQFHVGPGAFRTSPPDLIGKFFAATYATPPERNFPVIPGAFFFPFHPSCHWVSAPDLSVAPPPFLVKRSSPPPIAVRVRADPRAFFSFQPATPATVITRTARSALPFQMSHSFHPPLSYHG